MTTIDLITERLDTAIISATSLKYEVENNVSVSELIKKHLCFVLDFYALYIVSQGIHNVSQQRELNIRMKTIMHNIEIKNIDKAILNLECFEKYLIKIIPLLLKYK